MSAEEAVSTSSQSPSVSSSAKKRKRDSIWEKFRNLHKDGIDYVQCIECPEVIYKSTVPASTLKYHWEESKKHKSVAVITSVGDDPGAKKLTKLEQIDRAFTKVLSVPSMPINAFLHPDMRSFIDLLNRRLVSQFKTKPSITCDIWTDASMKNAYLGVTLYFVKDSQLRTAFLGLRCLHGAHTAINIRQEVIRVLEEYGLTLDEIFKVVTDNGSNILSAFADVFELLNELPCYEYDEDDDDYESITFPAEDVLLDNMPQQISCYAHSLQLVIMKIFKDGFCDAVAFKKMCDLICRFKHSHQALQELALLTDKALISLSATRWGSVIEVIKRFLELQEYVVVIARRKSWPITSDSDLEQLASISKALGPFVEVLRRIQGEKYVTISHCLEYTRAIILSLDDFNDDPCLAPFIERIRTMVKERFTNVLNMDRVNFDPIFFVACALDPTTAECLDDSDLAKCADWVRQMVNRFVFFTMCS